MMAAPGTSRTASLTEESRAKAFYEERYSSGYMDEWPLEKKQRIFDLVRALGLPQAGRALDFGCGNGVFTEVLRQALGPGWKVTGCEISDVAIENARRRFPGCEFVPSGDPSLSGRAFDFFFSHHVLEHVSDLTQALRGLDRMTAATAVGLHVLPCGNPGSFQHGLAMLRHDGIDAALGNRFFLDEEGHVRRLTTDQLMGCYEQLGFRLVDQHYAGHEFSTCQWATAVGPERVLELTAPGAAVDRRAWWKLVRLRLRLLGLWAFRHPAQMVRGKLGKPHWSARDVTLLVAGLPLYPLSRLVDRWLVARASTEWTTRSADRRGAEMYLVFQR
jgi:SAM-dependent methyltransferase